jgi:hypothetical protein
MFARKSWDSCWPDSLGLMSARCERSLLPYSVQTATGTHLASCPMGNGLFFWGGWGEHVRYETDHSLPSSAKKNGGVIPPFP